jgi:hypothetical protein
MSHKSESTLILSARNVPHEIQTHLDLSHHGPPYPFKDAGSVADSLTGFHSAMSLFAINRSWIHKGLCVPTGENRENSSQPSAETMKWTTMHVPHSCSDCQLYIFSSSADHVTGNLGSGCL